VLSKRRRPGGPAPPGGSGGCASVLVGGV